MNWKGIIYTCFIRNSGKKQSPLVLLVNVLACIMHNLITVGISTACGLLKSSMFPIVS